MMPSSAVLPAGVNQEALLTELRRLSWGAADILRAYARGEQPPHDFPKALSVDEGGEGPVSAADLAVNKWLLDGLSAAFPKADWTLLSEVVRERRSERPPAGSVVVHLRLGDVGGTLDCWNSELRCVQHRPAGSRRAQQTRRL